MLHTRLLSFSGVERVLEECVEQGLLGLQGRAGNASLQLS